MNQSPVLDSEEWPLREHVQHSSVSSSTQDSESTSLLSFPVPNNLTPATSPPQSLINLAAITTESTVRLVLTPSVIISFVKESRLFKLKYSNIDLCKDSSGSLKCVKLGGASGPQGPFTHTFSKNRVPIPHLEQPSVSAGKPSYRISFLDAQTVQLSHTVFVTQPCYIFESGDDCVRFQEALLDQKVVFVAGVAEARSKGRGEECISQNLRMVQARNGTRSIIFFANSQRKEKKRYVSIPINCIDRVDQSKKAGRPIMLGLLPNFELLSQLKALQIQFFDDDAQKRFYKILCPDVPAED